MPNWKVWPSTPPRVYAFQLELIVGDLAGLPLGGVEDVGSSCAVVQVRWSGRRRRSMITRRAVEMNCTAIQRVRPNGTVCWREGFHHQCNLKMVDPEKGFKSWIVNLEIHGFGAISKHSSSILAKTQLDISKFVAMDEERSIGIPVKCSIRGFRAEAELRVTLKFSDPQIKEATASTIMRVASLREFSYSAFSRINSRRVPPHPRRRAESSADESGRSLAADFLSEEQTEKLVAGRSLLVDHFGGRVGDGEDKKMEKRPQQDHHFPYQVTRTHSLGRFLAWNRGKLGFKSTEEYSKDTPPRYEKPRGHGGDDIDDDRGAGSSVAASPSPPRAQEEHGVAGFEEGELEIGSWEERTVASRDGRLELVTEVFLASIDQRSEKAAGESACSVLAAVIADWLHRNRGTLPLRCQFDELVRQGSSEWRRLCADESHMEMFSDRHFDLDTVLGAKVRQLAVVTGKSYVGFFDLEATAKGSFEYLQGAMSFDSVWEELLSAEAGRERVYIAGWNDHFFVLKVEKQAVYLIDTLGERLFEGCDQAYILKFDRESRVYRTDQAVAVADTGGEQQEERGAALGSPDHDGEGRKEGGGGGGGSSSRRMVCEGLDACKVFIKGFLAALPLRELRGDMEKGLVGDAHLHRLLQIEFHYTSPL